jgi:hypothetical protein
MLYHPVDRSEIRMACRLPIAGLCDLLRIVLFLLFSLTFFPGFPWRTETQCVFPAVFHPSLFATFLGSLGILLGFAAAVLSSVSPFPSVHCCPGGAECRHFVRKLKFLWGPQSPLCANDKCGLCSCLRRPCCSCISSTLTGLSL